MATSESLDGVLPIDKPRGPTSHDVVTAARRALGVRRIGHTGTLDPFASGLLLLCVGTATRIAEYLTGLDKRYRATVRLGVRTDTDDDTGSIMESTPADKVEHARIARVLRSFQGEIMQVPPRYSAKKVGGERAYRLAREGRAVELDAFPVTIHDLQLTRFEPPELELEIHCSSGTYIRALARDIGDALGVGGHLTTLRRTAIGTCDVATAVPLGDLIADPSRARSRMMPTLTALEGMSRVELDETGVGHIRHGRAAPCDPAIEGLVALAADGRLVALASAEGGWLHPRKVFV
jgi:tRNA pseudouridine55 synthase